LATVPKYLPRHPSIAFRYNAIAPSAIHLDLSGIIRSGSNSILIPRPEQVSQAPNGELNENIRGCNSSYVRPHFGHAIFEESKVSLFFVLTINKPSERVNADSTASVILVKSFGSILSITASISCFLYLSSLIISSVR